MILTVFSKQREVLDACRAPQVQNVVLLAGPRKSTKTVAAQYVFCERAWSLPRRKMVIVSITQTVGVDGGVWSQFVDDILPAYMARSGMEWVKRPWNQGVTKIPSCKVSNQFGGVTMIQHQSLKVEKEAEDRFKGKGYTDIFINELSKFHNVKTLTTFLMCLGRTMEMPDDQQLFLADTNPAEDGTDSWIYQIWFELGRTKTDEELTAVCDRIYKQESSPERVNALRGLRDKLRLIEFTVDDNEAMTQAEKDAMFGELAVDDDLLQRYWYGRWVTASTGAVFRNVFRPAFHVQGELEVPGREETEIMVPEPGCKELCTSWDPGSSTNWAAVVEEVYMPKGSLRPSVKVLDENVVVDQEVDYLWFVEEMLKKMRFWQAVVGHPIAWTHYSDRSVLDMKDMESGKYFHQLIYEASEGEIELIAADRRPGSVRASVELTKLLFWEGRLFISRMCPKLIESIKSIPPGKTQNEALLKTSKHKHVLDAARYGVMTELASEMRMSIVNRMHKGSESRVIWTPA